MYVFGLCVQTKTPNAVPVGYRAISTGTRVIMPIGANNVVMLVIYGGTFGFDGR